MTNGKSPFVRCITLARALRIVRYCAVFLFVSSMFFLPTSPLQAEQGRLEVKVRPLTASVIAVPQGRESPLRGRESPRQGRESPPRRSSESTETIWERVRDNGAFIVEVEISNATAHAYTLKADKVTLRAASGERVKPLEASDDTPTPVLISQTIVPGANVRGYLSYPPGSYTGARGFLIQEQTQSNEGFSVNF